MRVHVRVCVGSLGRGGDQQDNYTTTAKTAAAAASESFINRTEINPNQFDLVATLVRTHVRSLVAALIKLPHLIVRCVAHTHPPTPHPYGGQPLPQTYYQR